MVTIRIGDDEESLTWEQWEQRVLAGRIPPYALVRFDPVTGEDFVPAEQLDMFRSLGEDPRRAFSDRYRRGAPPWMTALLAGVMIRIWWLSGAGIVSHDPVAQDAATLVREGFTLWHPLVLEDGQIWRVLTMGVLHYELLHIASNLVMFVYVGWHLERALGRINLLTIFFVSVLGGSVASMFLTPSVQSLGASGGVLGVVAAANVFGFIRHGLLSDRARIIFGWALLPYLVLIYALGWYSESTDNWAHTGGLVTGALLALVLDPPGLERRRGWSGIVNGVVWGSITALLAVFWLAGPSLIQLRDAEARRPAVLGPPPYRELEWSAPLTWQRSTVEGSSGFVSPAQSRRGWVVRTRTLTHKRADPLEEVEAWIAALRADWGTAVRAEEPTPVTLADRQGVHVVVHLGDTADPVRLERWVIARGMQVLEATWSVDEARHDRLSGLRDRVLETVTWNPPESLLRAQEAVDRKPRNRALQRQLAEQLLLVGDVPEAVAIWRELAAARPNSPDGWLGLLEAARVAPDSIGDIDTLWSEALAAGDLPQVATEVALLADEAGERPLAEGLLELAWLANPGDRHVRRARKLLGLPVGLSDVAPAHVLTDPMTGMPLDAPRREAVPGPWTLEQARGVGAELAAEREALSRALLEAPDATALSVMLLLEHGALPPLNELPGAIGGLIEDLRTLDAGGDVRWAPPAVREWLASRKAADPELLVTLEPFAADPFTGPDDPDPEDVDLWLQALGLTVVDGPVGPTLVRVGP